MRMGKTFDIWAFVSVFMLICNIYVFVKFKGKETVVTKVVYYITLVLFIASECVLIIRGIIGVNNWLVNIIVIIIAVIYIWIWLFSSEDFSFGTVLWGGIITVLYLFIIYLILSLNNIAEIQFIDDCIVIIAELFPVIIQNEWFKGISIAALGGVISGLVLNKISKKK